METGDTKRRYTETSLFLV